MMIYIIVVLVIVIWLGSNYLRYKATHTMILRSQEDYEGSVLQYGEHKARIYPGEDINTYIKYWDKSDKKKLFLAELEKIEHLHDFEPEGIRCKACSLSYREYAYRLMDKSNSIYSLVCPRHEKCNVVLNNFDHILDS